MLCVRQTLTEILLDVTNDEILAISRDTINRFKNSGIESLLYIVIMFSSIDFHIGKNLFVMSLCILIKGANRIGHYFKFNFL